jgi:hypothetical protein
VTNGEGFNRALASGRERLRLKFMGIEEEKQERDVSTDIHNALAAGGRT